jgi:hypothetical protein
LGEVRSTVSLVAGLTATLCSCSAAPSQSTVPDAVVRFEPDAEPRIEPKPERAALETGYVTACTPGTPEQEEARELFEALQAVVDELEPVADPAPFNAALTALLAHPCYALAEETAEDLAADSGLSARTFWDGGGYSWARHYLWLGDPKSRGLSYFAPTMRRSLTKEHSSGHPLAELLCSASDESCGALQTAWAQRADRVFERITGRDFEDIDPDGEVDKCEEEANEVMPGERYLAWRDCVAQIPPRRWALPLGGLAVPDRGWLVINGRRGHYQFCDEIRAYDLATGSAYVASSCSGLMLQSGGSVDQQGTDANRNANVQVGKLPREYLREATWMILQVDEVQPNVRPSGFGFPIPESVVAARPEEALGLVGSGNYSWSSGQTRLGWTYVRDGKALQSGELTWPGDYNEPARDHAVKLLQIAEAGFEGGCAPASLPRKLSAGIGGSVSGIDADPARLNTTMDALSRALKAKARRCSANAARK